MRLETPEFDPATIVDWVSTHLGHLTADQAKASGAFSGGQTAADETLAAFDVTGYAAQRNEVLPESVRGASKLSPYIRHGLLPLGRVWSHVEGGPSRDVSKYRFELLWQEYARHWYATFGEQTGRGVRFEQAAPEPTNGWPPDMLCVSTNLNELDADGWVVNQARMWLASQWAVRSNAEWREGEDHFFRHLLDGSRAANRLGWQWAAGMSKQKVYGFSRRQVQRRAPGLCDRCALQDACPITSWPDPEPRRRMEPPDALNLDEVAGPESPTVNSEPDSVWLTAESLGDADPALEAHPDLPAVFVFDEPLLRKLQLSSKRLVFLTETLADLAQRRTVQLFLGRPAEVLADRSAAVTYAPVPGYRRIVEARPPAAVYPWPWLRRPDGRSVASFSQWNRS